MFEIIVGFFGNIHVGFLEGGGGEREAWTQVYILRIMIILSQNIILICLEYNGRDLVLGDDWERLAISCAHNIFDHIMCSDL